jgi:hypothetical protein
MTIIAQAYDPNTQYGDERIQITLEVTLDNDGLIKITSEELPEINLKLALQHAKKLANEINKIFDTEIGSLK